MGFYLGNATEPLIAMTLPEPSMSPKYCVVAEASTAKVSPSTAFLGETGVEPRAIAVLL